MFFGDFSVNSQPIFMKFIIESLAKHCEIFTDKYCIVQKLDHLACNGIHGLKLILT